MLHQTPSEQQTLSQLVYRAAQLDILGLTEAVQLYLKAAQLGYAPAQHRLGNLYQFGLLGVEQDLREAVRWYHAAAKQDFADAQNNMGWMWQYGLGVHKDLEEAVIWYRMSAKNGSHVGKANYAYTLRHGLGVKKNLAKALKWYRRSGEKDIEKALLDLSQDEINEAPPNELFNLAVLLDKVNRARAVQVY